MRIEKTNIDGCLVLNPVRRMDHRGFFQEIYNADYGFMPPPMQINRSKSNLYVLRGIHVCPYGKLITCIEGEIFDVVVDLRKDSKTFGDHFSSYLYASVNTQIYCPPYCGHAMLSLATKSVAVYPQTGLYDPENEWAVNPLDKELGIPWPKDERIPILLSEKDCNALSLAECKKLYLGMED